MHRSIGLAAAALSAFTASVVASAPPPVEDLVRVLIGQRNLEDHQWQRLRTGGAVAALSTTEDPAQVSLVGAVRLNVPPEAFVDRFRAIERIERGKTVRQIGRFSATPCVQDLAALTLDSRDVESLRRCRPGDCGLQLPSEAIARLRGVSESAGGNETAVVDEYRRFLIELVNEYRRDGLASLNGYHDKDEPMSIGESFNRLFTRPGAAVAHLPELSQALRAYPRASRSRPDEFFYWSTLDFGLKPTVRINHVVIHPVDRGDGLRYAIASKQIYASHYFDAALELRLVVDDPANGDDSSMLIYSSDARSRALTGVVGSFLRGQVRSRARAALEHYLNTTKSAVEGRRGN